jgi:Predicted flavin-nucleotide-binding protein
MKNQIGYTQRVCEDRQRIDAFLESERVGVLGLYDGEYPYTVPVNFVFSGGSVYFHGMGSGKKERLLLQSPKVSFTVYREHGTVTDPVPCHADTAYFSVMLFGKAEKLADSAEAASALQKMLAKYLPGFYKGTLGAGLIEKYRSSMDHNPVSVYKISVEDITAKENAAEKENLFDPTAR